MGVLEWDWNLCWGLWLITVVSQHQGLCKGNVREYPHKIWPYMVQYLHFEVLKFPLNQGTNALKWEGQWEQTHTSLCFIWQSQTPQWWMSTALLLFLISWGLIYHHQDIWISQTTTTICSVSEGSCNIFDINDGALPGKTGHWTGFKSKVQKRVYAPVVVMGFHQKIRRNLEFGKAVHWGPQHNKNNLSDATCVSDKNGKSRHFSKIVPLKEDFAIAGVWQPGTHHLAIFNSNVPVPEGNIPEGIHQFFRSHDMRGGWYLWTCMIAGLAFDHLLSLKISLY